MGSLCFLPNRHALVANTALIRQLEAVEGTVTLDQKGSEKLEQKAAECELIAYLAVDKSTQRKNVRKAERYRKIADRLRARLASRR